MVILSRFSLQLEVGDARMRMCYTLRAFPASMSGPATMASRDRYLNTSLAKALRLLGMFDGECEDLSLTEMADALGARPGSIYPIVTTLLRYGYLQRDPATKRYQVGLRVLSQAHHLLARLDIREQAKPVLKRLARELSSNTHLGVLYENQVLFLDREELSPSVLHTAAIGQCVPAHCTAQGKVLLAFDIEATTRICEAGQLPASTQRTITDPAMLRQELAEVRRRGHALNVEELYEGHACVAAPIRNYRGTVVAGLSVSVASVRLERDPLDLFVKAVVDGAGEVSRAMGYSTESKEVGAHG